mgnify:CR=1 FL=1
MGSNDIRVLNGGFAPIEQEVVLDLTDVEGEIPKDLTGIHVRNGPNRRFEAPGRYHWFDGDGMVSQLVRVSGYKQVDHYAKQLNFPPQKIHPSALVIVNPQEPETSRARVWCAPTVEMGVRLLDAIREDYEEGKAANVAERNPKTA